MRNSRFTSSALCAVLAAAIAALNFIASLHLMRLDMIFYLISGALVYFAAVRYGVRVGAALCAVASALSFLLVPDKVWLLFFVGVFGPAAVVQSVFEKQMGRRIAMAVTIAAFIGLFSLFGYAIAYGGGFVPRIGLPDVGLPMVVTAMIFAAFSAVIAQSVNRGLYAMLSRRLRDTAGRGAAIVLPKLSDSDEDGIDNSCS